MAIPDCTAQKSETQSREHHKSLLGNFYQTWVSIEKNGSPPPVLRCFIASVRLALTTLHHVEDELQVLLTVAEERLAAIEREDDAVATFETTVGRTK